MFEMRAMTSSEISQDALRKAVITTAIEMNASGINRGKSGNVSVRWSDGQFDGFLITPTGLAYAEISSEHIVAVTLMGDSHGSCQPSTEWRFHRDIYCSRVDVGAIVHTHAPFSTALACLGLGIPAFHYMIALAGGDDIRCAPYATFGTQQLSDYALTALEGRSACLLANHGMIAIGGSLVSALTLAIEVETLAEIYWRSLQIGNPLILSAGEMGVVLDKFRGYGQGRLG